MSGRVPRANSRPSRSGPVTSSRPFGLTVPHGVLRRLNDTLVALPATPSPVTAATVTARLATSQALFDRAQYTALITGLPDLLAAAHELADTSTQPAGQAILAACYDLATHTLTLPDGPEAPGTDLFVDDGSAHEPLGLGGKPVDLPGMVSKTAQLWGA